MFKLVTDKKICNPIMRLIHENNEYSIDIPRDTLHNIVNYIDSDISDVHLISNYSSLRGFNIPFNYLPYDFGISIASKKSLQDYVHYVKNKDLTLEYELIKQFPDIVNGSLLSFIYEVTLPYANKIDIDVSSIPSNSLVDATKKVLIPHIFNHVMIPHSIKLIAERDPTAISEGGFYKDKVVLSIEFIDMYYNTLDKSLIGWGVARALLEEFSFFCENRLYIKDMSEIIYCLSKVPIIYDTTTVSIDITVDLNNTEKYLLNMFIDFDIYYAEKARQSERINKAIWCYIQDNYNVVDTDNPKQKDIYLELVNTLTMLSKYYVDAKELPDISLADDCILVNGDIVCKLSGLCKMEYSHLFNDKELLYNLLKEISECK